MQSHSSQTHKIHEHSWAGSAPKDSVHFEESCSAHRSSGKAMMRMIMMKSTMSASRPFSVSAMSPPDFSLTTTLHSVNIANFT